MTKITETQTVILFKAINNNKGIVMSLAASGMTTDARGYGTAIAGLIKKKLIEQSGVATETDYNKDGWRFRVTEEGHFALDDDENEETAELVATLQDELEDQADEDAEIDEEQESGSRVKESYKARYQELKDLGGNGQGCADDLNKWMSQNLVGVTVGADGKTKEGIMVDQLFAFAEENGISDYLKYAHLNNGMKAMNIANRLRAMARKGKAITHRGAVIIAAKEALAA